MERRGTSRQWITLLLCSMCSAMGSGTALIVLEKVSMFFYCAPTSGESEGRSGRAIRRINLISTLWKSWFVRWRSKTVVAPLSGVRKIGFSTPKISIVTPSYNQNLFVKETIESVLSQDYPNLEYIIIDGGSADGSVKTIEDYIDRLSYFKSEKDRGHGEALNKGFRQSTGEIMAWLNSDDKYMPWTFKTVASIFAEHPEVNWLVGTNGWWNDKGALVDAKNVYKNAHDYLRGDFSWIQQESVFWRRSLWEQAGGSINEDYKFMVDGELWTRFFQLEPLYHAHCLLGGYRFHSSNRARENHQACLDEMHKAITPMRVKMSEAIKTIPDEYRVLIYDQPSSSWKKFVTSRNT